MTKEKKLFALKPFLLPTIIYLVSIAIYTVWVSYDERNRIIDEVNLRLVQAARTVKDILPPDFHDRALEKTSISDSENLHNTLLLSKYAKTAGITYLYTTIIRDGKVHFTSSSATDEENKIKNLPFYWQDYPEATNKFKETLINTDKPSFESSEDRWGSFESAIICETSPGGNKYLVGADMDIGFIRESIMARIPYSLLRALFLLLIVFPMFIAIRNLYRKNTKKLSEEIAERKQAEHALHEYKSNLEEIIKSRTEQLEKEIADKNTIEQELNLAKELAVKESRAKSMFLANMSHEIRTPMNGVIGMANILKDTELNPEQREYLDIIEISGNNLLSIINDILDFSKIEAGQVELESIPFDLKQQIEEVTKILHTRAEGKGLKLFFSISPELPEKIKGDPVRLKQIILNLTNNAIKFTPEGSITIHVDQVWQKEGKVMLKCRVVDTGIGISGNGKEKLFKEFSQTDVSTTRRFGGTGLGLKISKDLTHLMGGEIGVESEEGKGSIFWFTSVFELVIKSDADRLKEEEKKQVAKALSILLVEDNYISQKVAKTSLDRDGYHNLEIAENGKVAVKMMKDKEYQIVLMDIRMPVMDGLECTEKIRELERNNPDRTPTCIVAFTAYAVEGDREKFMEAGMDDYIAKPFQPEELIRIIEKYANRIRFRSNKPLKILLAEDNKINQKVAVKTLESFGHKVDVVENGIDAIEKFKANVYDLIMMDLEMPEMDGLEATRAIRKMEQELIQPGSDRKRVKIVALTAHSTTDDKTRCLEAGMDDYISKPFRQAEMSRALAIN